MVPAHARDNSTVIPVLLLKTESIPTDAYRELFSSAADPVFDPRFVPVLQHRFEDTGLANFENLISHKQISDDVVSKYGGIIFTSQRAVEAFTKLVNESTGCDGMLKGLGILDPQTGQALPTEERRSRTYVVTIGPTTQQFLRDSFGFEPDASAEKPSPQGVWESIQNHRNSRTR
ncbi:Retrovirus-related Pol polyprotein from transposon TNT 1-94 [Emericellopsis cladophorae]|uniref:Retrovirus-related Pol polyprotein from transposon TNT 1-94 n=1 Tax=Emericellopsis cladophorae TaxID=2686198 RepID=A0A9Q0BCZ9_9HYPO|nr:Retrovirus-related Pol polyprotein from transposon TNT 1-94 [Emericellopsis cladophorae]KAI6779659.1 Retrovirus-related Pol polyprotein from transposon TNT 1-94 [Emericellopsis cladophorae]